MVPRNTTTPLSCTHNERTCSAYWYIYIYIPGIYGDIGIYIPGIYGDIYWGAQRSGVVGLEWGGRTIY